MWNCVFNFLYNFLYAICVGMREQLVVLHIINTCIFTQKLLPQLYTCVQGLRLYGQPPMTVYPNQHSAEFHAWYKFIKIFNVCICKCHVFCDVNGEGPLQLRSVIAITITVPVPNTVLRHLNHTIVHSGDVFLSLFH